MFIGQWSLNIDLTYKFDLSDATNANYPLKFSNDAAEGPNGDSSWHRIYSGCK